MARFMQIISAIDTHTDGEPTRIVLSGIPPIIGETMAQKKQYMKDKLDHIRTLLMQEPRGHKDMFGAIITPPTTNQSDYGIIFMDNSGYIDMCGSGIIGATTTLIEIGMIPIIEPETVVSFDTPAGLVECRAKIEESQVSQVCVANVPSFLYAKDVEITLPDIGKILVDVSFGGNFFAIVQAQALGVAVHPDNISTLIRLGMLVKKAVNEQISVQHPIEQHINTVEFTMIYEQPEAFVPFSQGVVIFGNGQMDRCPCGTGTSALMATLYGKNQLPLGLNFTSQSIIGTTFKGKLVAKVNVGDMVAVNPVLTGDAHITGIQQFVVDANDPLKYGFVVG
ncbi:proline racemase family protein [Anabaena sp. CA = ATCC 33047]|uniref:proline racemase family protein n=1 Tax=Anabaena sp. (strain CA / ATCC 33047) TaxID=52271 RepID=UPI00082A58FD|nr:proline racemase family protein [Anabaena sp. CA = ATCC 33047]